MKKVYFVLGMHRSGTSAVSSCINSLGIPFGDSLLAASVDNPQGYFENSVVQAFNETLLVQNGFDWDDVFFDFEMLDASLFSSAVNTAVQILTREFIVHDVFAIKDPRLCLLFPIWAQACKQLKIQISTVIVNRNPLEIAKSLEKRNGFTIQKSVSLWFEYLSKAELYSRETNRIVIEYGELVESQRNTFEKLANFLGASKEQITNATRSIHPDLRHHVYDISSLSQYSPSFEALANELASKELNAQVLTDAYSSFNGMKLLFENQSKTIKLSKATTERQKYKLLKENLDQQLWSTKNELEITNKTLQASKDELSKLTLSFIEKDRLLTSALSVLKDKEESFILSKQQRSFLERIELVVSGTSSTFKSHSEKLKSISDLLTKNISADVKQLQSLEYINQTLDGRIKELQHLADCSVLELNDSKRLSSSLEAELKCLTQKMQHSVQLAEVESENKDKEIDRLQQVINVSELASVSDNKNIKILRTELSDTKQSEEKPKEAIVVSEDKVTEINARLVVMSQSVENNSVFKTKMDPLAAELECLKEQHAKLTHENLELSESLTASICKREAELTKFNSDKVIIKENTKSRFKKEINCIKSEFDSGYCNLKNFIALHQKWSNFNHQQLVDILKNKKLATSAVPFLARRLVSDIADIAVFQEHMLGYFKRVPTEFIIQFDEDEYLSLNEDVASAIDDGLIDSAMEHFILHGFEEVYLGKRKVHRRVRFFENAIPNVTSETSESYKEYLEHFCENARNEEHLIKQDNPATVVLSSSPNPKAMKTVEPENQGAIESNVAPHYLSALDNAKNKTVDILLPVYNALDDVKNCIDSLYRHRTFEFNLIVIDDCSESETGFYLEEKSRELRFTLLRNKENLRFTKSVNKGFAQSKADVVILLNSDTIVTPFWLEKILLCFQSDKVTGIVGPLSNAASWQTVPVREDKVNGGWLVNEIPQGYSIDLMSKLIETVSKREYPLVPSVNGFCYAIRREVINKIGTLDEEYFPTGYGEEDDFSLRARAAGYSIRCVDDTYIFHAKSKSYTHKVRKVLTVGGRKSLDKKHGKAAIEQLISDWKGESRLPGIAQNINNYMQLSSQNKKVVYTAIFGNYDSLNNPEYINPDWDYVCFTHNPHLKSDVFKIMLVTPVFESATKNARMLKILSHVFLIDYELSLWIDGNVKLRGKNIDEIPEKFLVNSDFSLHKHVKRTCLYDEEEACAIAKKDNVELLAAQVEFYKIQGMPRNYGMFETAELARKQGSADVLRINTLWWQQLSQYSIRDQIALPFVFWGQGYSPNILPGSQWIDPYFHMYKHASEPTLNHGPFVNIVIPITDNAERIFDLLDMVVNKTCYLDVKISLLLMVEINSVASILTKAKKLFPNIEISVFKSKSSSITNAINQSICDKNYELICILSEHVVLFNSDWLSKLVHQANINKDVSVLGPTILNENFDFLASSVKLKRSEGNLIGFENAGKLGGTGKVGALHDGCVLIKYVVLKQSEVFDERFETLKSAVIDLCLSNSELGYKNMFVVNSEVIICKETTKHSDEEKLIKKHRSV